MYLFCRFIVESVDSPSNVRGYRQSVSSIPSRKEIKSLIDQLEEQNKRIGKLEDEKEPSKGTYEMLVFILNLISFTFNA